MFVDYKLRVFETYLNRRIAQSLSSNLIIPSPAKLRAECVKVCLERYSRTDDRVLRDFFGDGGNKENCVRAIERIDVDRFRPLVSFLNQKTPQTSDKNIELLAWLINFQPRPYDFGRSYERVTSVAPAIIHKAVEIVNPPAFNIFLSYAWANTDIADEIDNEFQSIGIHFIRDVRDAKYRTSIKDFMHKVGKSDFVLMLISDEYLRSENCMYEVNELLNTHDFEKRILPIVIENAVRIFKPINRTEYYIFWNEAKMAADKNKLNFPNQDTLEYALKCQRIVDNLPEFFRRITDINVSTFAKLKEGNFKDLLKTIGVYDKLEHDDTLGNPKPATVTANSLNGAAFIEHRPYATSEHVATSHFVIVVNGIEVNGPFSTQSAAKTKACELGYRPIHVARTRHLQDRSQPAHWRVDPC